VGLGTEHGDVVKVGGELEQFFQGANPGHAVTDHHQSEFFHAVLRAGPTADCCLAMPLKIQQRKKASHWLPSEDAFVLVFRIRSPALYVEGPA